MLVQQLTMAQVNVLGAVSNPVHPPLVVAQPPRPPQTQGIPPPPIHFEPTPPA